MRFLNEKKQTGRFCPAPGSAPRHYTRLQYSAVYWYCIVNESTQMGSQLNTPRTFWERTLIYVARES